MPLRSYNDEQPEHRPVDGKRSIREVDFFSSERRGRPEDSGSVLPSGSFTEVLCICPYIVVVVLR